MDCPKCRSAELSEKQLSQGITVQQCSECQGNWISATEYEKWQKQTPQKTATSELLRSPLDFKFFPPEGDAKAGLCPECSRYLSRAKVKYRVPFFVERCQECEGFWCDQGEWEVLTQLGLSSSIEQFFERQWQMKMREQEYLANERQTLIEKLGPELAQKIFALSEQLMNHPNGDYALAFLMRKVMKHTDVQELKEK
ncbi:MAG: zf-TFIIB domain-containing protein [Kamptonema sp. SIO4C4]|nr:zf-TFIIB domain-containing protein [Kamptonema sp. SIO4C4]